MNVGTFLQHHRIRTNPFMDEEARHDEVFARLRDESVMHADVPKVLGDPAHPSTSIVFGEKGSGKTAIRLQIERSIEEHNATSENARAYVIPYDDLNPILDRFSRRVKGKDPLTTLQKITLNDHIDGILSFAVPGIVDAALEHNGRETPSTPVATRQEFRRLDRAARADLVLLQSLYDRPERAVDRMRMLRRRLHLFRPSRIRPLRWLLILLLVVTAALGIGMSFFELDQPQWVQRGALAALILLTFATLILVLVDLATVQRLARSISGQLRVLDRSSASVRRTLELLPRQTLISSSLPVDGLDETRYAMFARLLRVLKPLGYKNVIVLIDRIDEPTLIRGDRERMQAVVWPLLNNKFLQQPGFAVKMMLPLELRYALYGESSDFFQEARLDKQNLVDRLQWSGVTLYDLCNKRIAACTEAGAEPPRLVELFDQSITREDIAAALDQMRQPRDAFKLLYQMIQIHCSNHSEEDAAWRIGRHTLQQALGQQKERIDALRSGLAPA